MYYTPRPSNLITCYIEIIVSQECVSPVVLVQLLLCLFSMIKISFLMQHWSWQQHDPKNCSIKDWCLMMNIPWLCVKKNIYQQSKNFFFFDTKGIVNSWLNSFFLWNKNHNPLVTWWFLFCNAGDWNNYHHLVTMSLSFCETKMTSSQSWNCLFFITNLTTKCILNRKSWTSVNLRVTFLSLYKHHSC